MSTGATRKHRSSEDAATIPAPTSELAREEAEVKITFNAHATPNLVGENENDGGSLPSGRPTSVPDYDVEAVAAASFASKKPQLPLDLAVPIARKRASVDGAPLRAAFLLSHVDDRMTISEIASSAQIPIHDAVECFALLADLGLVELRGASDDSSAPPVSQGQSDPGERARPPQPKSGLRPKT